MAYLLIHSARQLVTLRGPDAPRRGPELDHLHVIEDGAVLIEDDTIREVGTTRRLENLAETRSAKEISAAGRVVMPGFVDCHTHLISGPPPNLLGAVSWIPTQGVRSALDRVPYIRDVTAKRLATEGSTLLQHCAAHGTTTIEAKSGYALNLGGEIKILRSLHRLSDKTIEVVPTFFGAHVVPPEFEDRPARYIRLLTEELLPTVRQRGLARFVDGCSDTGAFSVPELRLYFQRASQLGFGLKLHYAQFGATDGLALASEFRFTSIDHCEHGVGDHIVRAATNSIVVFTPACSLFLCERPAPAREIIRAGIPVALATNLGYATTPTSNMQLVIFLATRLLGFTPGQAITAATINAAHALKLGSQIGSIEPGKQADLTILNLGDYREIAYDFGINLVGVTIKRGDVVFDSSASRWQSRL